MTPGRGRVSSSEVVPIDAELRGLEPGRPHGAPRRPASRSTSPRSPAADWLRPSRCRGVDRAPTSSRDLAACRRRTTAPVVDGEVGALVRGHGGAGGDLRRRLQRRRHRPARRSGRRRAAAADSSPTTTTRRPAASGNDGDGDVDTSVGLYPARWQAFHLAGELATHADDLFVPGLSAAQADGTARLASRGILALFALHEAKPDLALESSTHGRTRVRGEYGDRRRAR